MAGPQPTVVGTIDGDIINPNNKSSGVIGFVTAGKDIINSFGGNDTVEGGGGDDTVFMGDGTDTFTWRSGDGSDLVFGGNDIDTLRFNASDAFTIIDVGRDGPAFFGDEEFAAVVSTVAGNVFLEEVDRIEINTGSDGHFVRIDELDGTRVGKVAVNLAAAGDASGNGAVDAVLVGDTDGNDQITVASIGTAVRVTGLAAEVTVDRADAGKDELQVVARDGNDVLDASQLQAGSMVLKLFGGDGNDTLIGGASAARLFGGNGEGEDRGIDTASYSASDTGVSVNLLTGKGSGGHADGDTLLEIENLVGSAFADTLIGDLESNALDGGAGNDTLTGGAGADRLNGGDGVDTASYAASASAVNMNLAAGTGTGGDADGDTFTSIENLVGSAFGDTLTGSAAANVINGGEGNDILSGGFGRDELVGAGGRDNFVFDATLGKTNADKIAGFKAKADTILLDGDLFLGLNAGSLKENAFFEGAKAHDANDRIILTDKGKLLFDADGKGGDKAVLFAKIGKDVDLSHHDFIVI